MYSIARVLLAGGDEPRLSALHQALEAAGHTVSRAADALETAQRIGCGEPDVVVLSPELAASLDHLVDAQHGTLETRFVVLGSAAHGALQGSRRPGVADVVDPERGEHEALLAIERAAREEQLKRELALLRARVGDAAQQALVGRSAGISRVRELVGRAAASRAPVLIMGEPGTGKDVVAHLVHDLSERAARPVVTVRCAGADAEALELELFGRAAENGTRARAGLLEEARGGTIILDDTPSMPAPLRAQLARVSATRAVKRMGAPEPVPVDARLVLTARIGADVDDASIDDLAGRFNAMVIELPPLRERRSDIPQLVQHFRQRLAEAQGVELAPLPPEDLLQLLGREWSGNVRELEHWVERHALVAHAERARGDGVLAGVDLGSTRVTLEQLERAYILHVLAQESGHQSRTAVRLGIDRRTLYRKLKQYRSE